MSEVKTFTLEQINAAHSKVESGADFPAYIQEIKQLGVADIEVFVNDGYTVFSGSGHKITSPAEHEEYYVAEICDVEQFRADLKAHQQGKTNYPTFCRDCAKSGIAGWVISIEKMTCIYLDKQGKEVLVEQIPT